MTNKCQFLMKSHHRSNFDCGNENLNFFLKKQASQYQKRGLCQVYVSLDEKGSVIGYYTISTASVDLSILPESEQKNLPKHPVPVVHLGRLAVCRSAQGKGLGEYLLMDAFDMTMRLAEEVGIFALEVNAIDGSAMAFYSRYGFTALRDNKRHMYISLKTLKKL